MRYSILKTWCLQWYCQHCCLINLEMKHGFPSTGKSAGDDAAGFISLLDCDISSFLRLKMELTVYSLQYMRKRSNSLSSRHHKSRSPLSRHPRSRSSTPKRSKRQRKRSLSSSPLNASPYAAGTKETKNAKENLRKEEEERKRRQAAAELKLSEEETARRVAEAIRKKVREGLDCDEIRFEIDKRLEEGRKKLFAEVAAQLEKEKEDALIESRKKEEQSRREKEETERVMEENHRKVEEAQRKEALEQQRLELERYRELEELQRKKEESLRRKKQLEEEERAKQMKLLGKDKSRPKLSFAFGLKNK